MEVRGQLKDPVALPQRKETPIKVKVKLSMRFFVTEYHAMKTY
jgi:hypothetical protein